MGWISDAVDTVSDAIKEGFDAVTDVAGGVLDLVNDALDEVLGVLDLDIADVDVASQAAGTLVAKTGAVVPLPVVYGRRGLGGTLIYMTTTGNKNKFLWLVYAIADG